MSTDLLSAPTNQAAEWSVLGHMLNDPPIIGEVIGFPLAREDFSQADTRTIFQTTVERHYASQSIDALVVAELARDELSQYWNADAGSVGLLLDRRAREAMVSGSVGDHMAIVRRLSLKRQLQTACVQTLAQVNDGKLTPEEIGDSLSTTILQVTAGTQKRSELLSWMEVGTEYAKQLAMIRRARQDGHEIGVYTGLPFFDNYTAGIGPGELCFLAGEAGVGKTAVAWAAALGFAERQARRPLKPGQRPVLTGIFSMEMGLYSSTGRIVQNLTGIDGIRLREGQISDHEFEYALREWQAREALPIKFNFASNFRLSQLRALVAEGIRRYNLGFVVIDHFRMLDTDRRYQNALEADEVKVRFLKENIAKDLNVAVLCLAHTVKAREDGGKPRMSDVRGSGMISAFADQVGLLWSPYKYMSDDAKREMMASPTDVELLWDKNRFGAPATAQLSFYADKMLVKPR